jgi:GR25 family glycosyltransferase involved in LPS biosynthesis
MSRVLERALKALRQPERALAKLRRPHLVARNIVYGYFNHWPVTRLSSAEVRELPFFCISLPRARKRRELMQRQADGLGLSNFRIVDAVDASTLDAGALVSDGVYDDEETRRLHGSPLTLGQIACSLSHGLLYERIAAEGLEQAVILEDDALFVAQNLDALRPSELPHDYDVVLLNSFLMHEPPRGHIQGNLYSDESYRGSTAGYLVSGRGAKKLAEAYKPIIHDADGLIGRLMPAPAGRDHPFKQKGARMVTTCYIAYPHCVLNGSTSFFSSTILQ